jgi:predicted flap endonuclease-1-like 5' DNA nuclease
MLALVVVTIVLILFLTRIGVIFDVEKKVDKMFEIESQKLAEARKRELEESRGFRDDMRRELNAMREDVRKEFNNWDSRIQDAVRAANQAAKMAEQALARADALTKEPAYRTTIEQLVKDVASILKDVAALRNADKVNSPLLKELQDKVVALEGGQKRLTIRVDETMESIERRDMEQAAMRQTLDQELAGLKKRETLLLVKQRELEDTNVNLVASAKPKKVEFAPGEEKHHVIAIEGIGPAYASRLNANGIITIPQLVAVDANHVGNLIGATPELVKQWQAMAELLRLKGVGPQSAEVLVAAGILSTKQLAAETPESVSRKVKDAERGRKTRIQGQDVTPAVAQHWIEAARKGDYDAN